MNNKFIPLSRPCFGEEEKNAVIKAMDSGWVTFGPKTLEFEKNFKKFVKSRYAAATSSATSGLHLAMIAAGITKGDEVIAPVFTFAATINPAIHLGAKPVLIDVKRDTFNIDTELIERKITKKTKAIIPVHYAGQAADMDKIMLLAKKYKLIVIEDAAHAIGSKYKNNAVGNIGDLTVFSFHPIKNITTGDGGMITYKNKRFDELMKIYRLHGMDKSAWKRLSKSGNWFYEITVPGYKYNMTDIAASMGIEQLKKIKDFNGRRKEIAHIYNKELESIREITVPYVDADRVHAWNLYSILLDIDNLSISRNDFIEELKKNNIGSSVYFTPLHFHPFYKRLLKYKIGDFPNAEWVYDRIMSIPMYAGMKKVDGFYVAGVIKTLIKKYQK